MVFDGSKLVRVDNSQKVVEVNQLLEGYHAGGIKRQYVVYDIEQTNSGYLYKLINIDNKEFHTSNYLRPLSQIRGFGVYYDDSEPKFMSVEEVAKLLTEVTEIENEREKQKAIEKEKKEAIKELGRKRLEEVIPEDVVGVVIACLREDESDSMTDYYGYSVRRKVLLGISNSKRNSFAEMRKMAANFEETKHLAEYNPEYEHRENYSGGGGYFLGKSRYSGWVIYKECYRTREEHIDDLAYYAGDEDNIQVKSATQNIQVEADTSNLNLELVEYSDRSVAVFGDTKPIKDILGKQLHGLFKWNLTHNGQRKAGWIFSKKQEPKVRETLNL
ncbi:MAG: hypothetical protein LUH04_18015 [Clostridium sp.]|nr:hypothetical protein [Clostridium sp.]